MKREEEAKKKEQNVFLDDLKNDLKNLQKDLCKKYKKNGETIIDGPKPNEKNTIRIQSRHQMEMDKKLVDK